MHTLTWAQVHAWRLSQHSLTPRLQREDFLKAVTRTGGIQAQVFSAAELALWARTERLTREDIQAELWQEHSLIKTWAMRGTLHLLTTNQLPVYVAARSLHDSRNWAGYFAYYGITPAQQEAFLSAVPHVLSDTPLTRQQLADAIARHTGISALRELILASGWGSPLKPSAFRGDLCFGPNQGQNVTFVNPRAWADSWPSIEPEQALQDIVRRYLQAYGPARREDFARWWWGGNGMTMTKKIFQSLEDELVEVDIEGWRAIALRATLAPMQSLEAPTAIQLLPLFDAYTVGLGRDVEPLLARASRRQVFRPQGWISAVVLVNGSIQGIWQYATKRAQTVITVQMFSSPTRATQTGVTAEAERLGTFLKTPVELVYA